ncbi:hypothetical protein VF21_01490 [Pseudogymnoascus sp. 05NY08]|nr:hypothetical protein VF21_01490 [Pseudogymnoascus sp. 05NY08]
MLRPMAIRTKSTSHCIPEEPPIDNTSPRSAVPSLTSNSSADEEEIPKEPRRRRASTVLISQNADDARRIIGESGTRLIETCCGGGCCMLAPKADSQSFEYIPLPDNDAFRALGLNLGQLPRKLTAIHELPPKTVSLSPVKNNKAPAIVGADPDEKPFNPAVDQSIDFTPHTAEIDEKLQHNRTPTSGEHPPKFVKPHPPYEVFSAKIFNTRELTRAGAQKRTFHFDLDVSDYPAETGVDFKVGGAIGVQAPNEDEMVEEIMDLLSIPRVARDRAVLVTTTSGRWPTIWGEDKPRSLVSTRRDLLTWCADIQSYPPTKSLLRVLAEHTTAPNEQKILNYLCSAEGQGKFCDLRTGPHLTLAHLLHAFPSAKPPLDHLLAVLKQLMPRFYSLSNDPYENCVPVKGCSRLIEIAVTVHETESWRGDRTGLSSGFFERQARKFLAAEARGEKPDLRIPMFKGLMTNPLAREFISDGPMLLIGAGVGVAPFRGFVQRRLKSANCANKVWVLQGVRDSLLDELYSGEWGVHEDEVKKVVQSRTGVGRYVQEEVVAQKDLCWFVINALDGRIFVCGSSKGMGEGVESSLVQVGMEMGNMSRAESEEFWRLKKDAGQYIAETW